MAVGVANQDAALKAKARIRQRRHARRNKSVLSLKGACDRHYVCGHKSRLPVNQVVGAFIGGSGPAIAWREIFKELNARTWHRTNRSDVKPCSKHIVQVLLFAAIILAFAGDIKPEHVAIELQARVRVAHDDRSVIYAEKQLVRWLMPFRRAFIWRKLKNLKRVPVGVLEIKGPNAGCGLDGQRQCLRPTRRVLDSVQPQPRVSLIHISGNDGYMLKPPLVAA